MSAYLLCQQPENGDESGRFPILLVLGAGIDRCAFMRRRWRRPDQRGLNSASAGDLIQCRPKSLSGSAAPGRLILDSFSRSGCSIRRRSSRPDFPRDRRVRSFVAPVLAAVDLLGQIEKLRDLFRDSARRFRDFRSLSFLYCDSMGRNESAEGASFQRVFWPEQRDFNSRPSLRGNEQYSDVVRSHNPGGTLSMIVAKTCNFRG
jgi:hypothetical protein